MHELRDNRRGVCLESDCRSHPSGSRAVSHHEKPAAKKPAVKKAAAKPAAKKAAPKKK